MIVMEEITEAFDCAEQINLYREGVKVSYAAGSAPFTEIMASWTALTENARPMPAYGVSLNGETLRAMQRGLWIEFGFGSPCSCYGMPFEKLLIEVGQSFSGLNLIRYNADYGYDGRCFYLDLNGRNTGDLYELLKQMP